MKIGIMQPYLFPYIGYFQLINAVDKFIIYDDVSYIKQGWINRNRILLHDQPFLFTVPVAGVGPSRLINDTPVSERTFTRWKKKFYNTLEVAYRKAPFYESIRSLVTNVLDTPMESIGELSRNSVVKTMDYLGIGTAVVPSSVVYLNSELKGEQRVMDICSKEQATLYMNAPGGSLLYDKQDFAKQNIQLLFINPGKVVYRQFENEFVPSLSIIDVMMFNSVSTIKGMLNNYNLT